MASLTGGANLATDPNFQKRVAMAFFFVAREVYSESETVENHPLRVSMAQALISSNVEAILRYTGLVVTAPTIVAKTDLQLSTQSNVSDQEIILAVREIWNALAGVRQ